MIVTAMTSSIPLNENEPIVFIPIGRHEITPTVNGKPKRITVNVTSQDGGDIADRMQSVLESRLSSNVRPILDFDHMDTGPAAALPKRIYFEESQGIMCEVEWTGSGKRAIVDKDFSYFSPVFLIGEDGVPITIPDRGPLGSLVNDPAFREIPRIAAADAAKHKQDDKPKNNMNDLVVCGLLSESEAAKDTASDIARARVNTLKDEGKNNEKLMAQVSELSAERDKLSKQIDEAKAQINMTKKEKANDAVKAAVAAGKIAPKDEETQKFYEDLIVEKGEAAVKALNALPSSNNTILETKVNAGSANHTNQVGGFQAEAEKVVKAGRAESLEDAYEMVADEKPDLYREYCDNLGK